MECLLAVAAEVDGSEERHCSVAVVTSAGFGICSEVDGPASMAVEEMASPLRLFSYTPQQYEETMRRVRCRLASTIS
jgi:hypothetical protein